MQSIPTIEPSGKSFSKINGNINEIINYFLVRKKRNEINYVTFSQEHNHDCSSVLRGFLQGDDTDHVTFTLLTWVIAVGYLGQ